MAEWICRRRRPARQGGAGFTHTTWSVPTGVCCTTLYWPVTGGATATHGSDHPVTRTAPPHGPGPIPDRGIAAAAIGLDVGGGSIKVGAVLQDAAGRLHAAHRWPGLEHLGPRRVGHRSLGLSDATDLDQLCSTTAQRMAAELAHCIPPVPMGWGVAAAAWIRPDDGHSVFSPHLTAWRDHPVRAALTTAVTSQPGPLRTAPAVANDADAAAWAEARLGAGADLLPHHGTRPSRLVFVAIGTGIGGALIRDGVLETGAHGMAGEYGHMSLDPSGPPCACGGAGCWETLVSASALAHRAGRTSARSVLDDALAGDRRCEEALVETGRWLGRGLSVLTAALDPDLLVIGGGVSVGGELLLGPARTELERLLPGRRHRSAPAVVGARLGNDAGWLGAAGLAFRPERRRRDPDLGDPSPAEG